MLNVKMLLAAAIIAAGSTAALAQTGGEAGASGAAGSTGAGTSGGTGAGASGGTGGTGLEPPRRSDANPPGAIYRGGSGIATGRSDDMRPLVSVPTAAPAPRVRGYKVRSSRARAY